MRCKDASGSGPEILCFGIGSIRLPLCGSAAISDSTSHNITTSSPIARFSHTHTHNTHTHSLPLLLALPCIASHRHGPPLTRHWTLGHPFTGCASPRLVSPFVHRPSVLTASPSSPNAFEAFHSVSPLCHPSLPIFFLYLTPLVWFSYSFLLYLNHLFQLNTPAPGRHSFPLLFA